MGHGIEGTAHHYDDVVEVSELSLPHAFVKGAVAKELDEDALAAQCCHDLLRVLER